ncbi:MAG: hypothetical protein J5622_05185 [Firmicutes bacterium]|nr:hypothetical protein [Bacillota bacterium]
MLDDIGIRGGEQKQIFNGKSALVGMITVGHQTIDICALGEAVEALDETAKEMSLADWLAINSSFPPEKWKFYLGIDE